jgi:hypothetical protein
MYVLIHFEKKAEEKDWQIVPISQFCAVNSHHNSVFFIEIRRIFIFLIFVHKKFHSLSLSEKNGLDWMSMNLLWDKPFVLLCLRS